MNPLYTPSILEASDAALARAFALHALTSRFTPAVEAGMRLEHLQALEAAIDRLDDLLKAAWPDTAAGPVQPDFWSSHDVLEAARRLDRLLGRTLAKGSGATRAEVLAALRLLQARTAAAAGRCR